MTTLESLRYGVCGAALGAASRRDAVATRVMRSAGLSKMVAGPVGSLARPKLSEISHFKLPIVQAAPSVDWVPLYVQCGLLLLVQQRNYRKMGSQYEVKDVTRYRQVDGRVS